ncbi:germin-like protein subfamily 3 member 2-like [Hibiscus syriacus]|uniref:Germin-like protein subfamily 3 member 2-like n=1 Tax=Hibiscus syriacus TaxID=106335 RepID=A0A6A3BSS5_HIBSY|nr:uncharacterized protein LOC120211735 [Hibiscus syriacus]KAE8719001.1 germin-like protein subfamily 3 member 2-like [Hibiscus syriacus]
MLPGLLTGGTLKNGSQVLVLSLTVLIFSLVRTKKLLPEIISAASNHMALIRQQGEYESVHRDLIIGFGTWEFSPMDLENPFPNNEGSVHLWHGDEDLLVLVSLQRYIAQQLPWIQYHELRGAGHIIPHAPWMSDNIVKALLVGEK